MTQNSDSIVDVQSGMPPPGERASRPSVFLSETSALILVVEIGFLRHRSRRRGTRWKEGGGGGKKWPGGKETDFGARSHMTSAEKMNLVLSSPCHQIATSSHSMYVFLYLPFLDIVGEFSTTFYQTCPLSFLALGMHTLGSMDF